MYVQRMSKLRNKIMIEIDDMDHDEIKIIQQVTGDLISLAVQDVDLTRIRCFHSFMKILSNPPTDPDVWRQCEYNMMDFEKLHKEKGMFSLDQITQLKQKFEALLSKPKQTLDK
jgi:hypothetical protein